MAKQNVTFIERHLEKIVIGVTGAVLAAITVLYLIGTPHQVDVQGESVGPNKLYEMIRSQADTTRETLNRAALAPSEGTASAVSGNPDQQMSPYDAMRLPREFALAPVPLNPPVPEVQGAQRGGIRLAEVLPPTSIRVSTGMAHMKLPEPQFVESSQGVVQPSDTGALTQNHFWVVVFGAISRKEQHAKFDEARYALERQNLIVAGVEAEREERLPDGQWGGSAVISGYAESKIRVQRTAVLTPQDDGTSIISVADMNTIAQFRQLLESPETQSRLLRPPFQNLLEVPILWQAPIELPAADGTMLKLADFGAIVEEAAKRPGPGARAAVGAGAGGPGGFAAAGATPQQLLQQANQLIGEKKFLDAETLLRQIDTMPDAPLNLKNTAKQRLAAIQRDLDQLRAEALRKERLATAAKSLGPENEPLWLTDTTVVPGRTYRYRLRLLAFNPYVGNVMQLAEPRDAARIVTESPWSEWSDPVQVKAGTHLFFTGVREDTGTANLVIRSFENGTWRSISRTGKNGVVVGDPVTFGSGSGVASYEDALVAGLIPKTNWPDRLSKGAEITYQDKTTSVLVLITADGQVEERSAIGDAQRKSQLEREIVEEKKRIDAASSEGPARPVMPGHDQPPRGVGPFAPGEDPMLPRR